MNYREKFRLAPGSRVRLKDHDLDCSDPDEKKKSSRKKVAKLQEGMNALQFRLYAEQKHSLLICLQAPDAGGKDGVVRHVIVSMNPQGCRVASFSSRRRRNSRTIFCQPLALRGRPCRLRVRKQM